MQNGEYIKQELNIKIVVLDQDWVIVINTSHSANQNLYGDNYP